MDGRRWAAAAALLPTLAGCSAIDSINTIEEARRERAAQRAPVVVDRPDLAEIFRDGRYDFRQADQKVERVVEDQVMSEPTAKAEIDDIMVKEVYTRRRRGVVPEMVAISFVLSDVAVGTPGYWDAFVAGTRESGVELEESSVDGTQVAFSDHSAEPTLMVYYAPDLIVILSGDRSTSRSDLEDLAEYLLAAR